MPNSVITLDGEVFVVILFQSTCYFCYIHITLKVNYKLIVAVGEPKIFMNPALALDSSLRTSKLLKLKAKRDIIVRSLVLQISPSMKLIKVEQSANVP